MRPFPGPASKKPRPSTFGRSFEAFVLVRSYDEAVGQYTLGETLSSGRAAQDCRHDKETGSPMSQSLQTLTERLVEFRDARDWKQFHSLKNLILSVSIEAAELLELTQWKDEKEAEAYIGDPDFRTALAHECADVLIYLLLIGERAGFDLVEAASEKIEINAAKYPVERARGNARKYTDL
jgi:NTP pyrophosphatase (non-canonical NTP hydrolase)